MFKRRKKAQGALEYLLLIGGAVLIAVIVIALLVGMGGQSRDAAKKQADKANATMTQPTAAQITQVTSKYNDCTSEKTKGAKDGNAPMTFSWIPGDGSNILFIADASGAQLDLNVNSNGVSGKGLTLNPTVKAGILVNVGKIGQCADTYGAYITTTKNNVPVTSMIHPVSWNQQ